MVQGGAATDERLPVLGYMITRTAADGTMEVVAENTENNETQYTDTGLMSETMYTYRVQSITLGGVGASAEASATTAEGPPPPLPPPGPVGKPDITAFTTSAGSASVTWTDGENAVGHLVLLLDANFMLVEGSVQMPEDNTATFTGLATGPHTVVVVAIADSASDGPPWDYKTETKAVP